MLYNESYVLDSNFFYVVRQLKIIACSFSFVVGNLVLYIVQEFGLNVISVRTQNKFSILPLPS